MLTTHLILQYAREQNNVDRRSNGGKTMTTSSHAQTSSRRPLSGLVKSTNQYPFVLMPPPSKPESVSWKRDTLDMAFINEMRDLRDEIIGRCSYANELPFNLVRTPY